MSQLSNLSPMYDELKERYDSLIDTDVAEAFSLMKLASSLQASYETELAELNRELVKQERKARAMHAFISRSSSAKVNDGDRNALCDSRVMKEWEQHESIQKACKLLEIAIKFISRVYYDCKLVYENCCRAMRDTVKGDMLVGHD